MKKNIIKTTIIVAIVTYAIIAFSSALSYYLSDVLSWTWYINVNYGLTFTQAVQKILTTPWMTALWAFEIFVLVPACSVYSAYKIDEFNLLTRATEN